MAQPILPPRGSLFIDTIRAFSKILDQNLHFVIWNRNCGYFLNSWFSQLDWEKVRNIDKKICEDDIPALESLLIKEVNRWVKRNPDVNHWFASDIADLVRRFFNNIGAEQVHFQLRPLKNSNSTIQSLDYPLRLICVYGSDGIKWIPQDSGKRLEAYGKEMDELNVANYQLVSSDIVLIKGSKWPGNHFGSPYFCYPKVSERMSLILEITYLS